MGVEPTLGHKTGAPAAVRGPKDDASRVTPNGYGNKTKPPAMTDGPNHGTQLELSPMSRKVRHFDKYSRKGGRWSWKRPSFERGVVSLVKTERRIEEGIASALTEVEAVEAGLRYFDELIMPPNKATFATSTTVDGETRRPPALLASPSGTSPQNHHQNPESSPPERAAKGRQKTGRRSNGGQAGGGFSRSQEKSARDYQAAKNRGIGRGGNITSSTDRAVLECADLKLTLKQRLDNYDRQRGINLTASHEDGASTSSPVPAIQDKPQGDDDVHSTKARSTNLGASSRRAASVAATSSGEAQGSGAFAPCYDGGISNNGGVEKILARSLGNAAAAVRRNRDGGGDSNANKKGGVSGSGSYSGKGINHTKDRPSVMQSRWRSWNQAPPEALLTAEEIRRSSASKQEDDRRRRRPPADVVAEVGPSFQCRRRFKTSTDNGTNPDGKTNLRGKATPSSSGAARNLAPHGEARGRGSKEGGPPSSTVSSASSHRSSAGAIPLVPRVATLAAAATPDKNRTEALRKGKDFDPDQLECVRRHEASVAEKERRVRSLRTEEEKRTHFRARPLPMFLESGGAAGSGGHGSGNGSSDGGGGDVGQSGRYQGSVISATGVAAGTSPDLLAALEQDDEARELAQKIRKINPRANIASIVFQSTPRGHAPPSHATLNRDSRRDSSHGSSSRGTAPTGANGDTSQSFSAINHPSTRLFVRGGGSTMPSFASSSEGGDGAAAATVAARSEMSNTAVPAPAHERGAGADSEPRAEGATSGSASAVPEKGSSKGVSPRASSGRALQTSAAALGGSGGVEDGDGRGSLESSRRSLMGRMLGSGMLERQREWAKERNRKVLESRRQVEEAKEREAKGDVLDAGCSGRSWSKAKTEHLRSLHRQREEEEAREQIQEARRRAAEVRAERERMSAEQRAAELAQNLATATDAKGAGVEGGRESRTAPNSRGGGGGRRSRRPPRRSRSDAGDGRTVDSTRRDGGIDEPTRHGVEDSPPAAGKGDNALSEDSFYRVAVEKIMEKERLDAAIGRVHGEHGGASGGGGSGGDSGLKRGGIRSSGRRRPRHGARKSVADAMVFAPPGGAVAGRPDMGKSLGAPRNRRKVGSATRTPLGQAAGRRRPSEERTTTAQGRTPHKNERAQSPAFTKEVTRTSSLLSLYEAQSVEHVAAGGEGVVGGRDNSGPFLDDDGGALLGRGGSVAEPPYSTARRGGLGERHSLTPAARGRLQGQAAAENTYYSPGGAEEEGDYPWSDEKRASWSGGSGGRSGRHQPATGNSDGGVRPGVPVDQLGWDDMFRSCERDGSGAAGGAEHVDGGTEVMNVSAGHSNGELKGSTIDNRRLLPLPAEGADGGNDRQEIWRQPSTSSPPSTQRRRESGVSPTRVAPHFPETSQPHLNGHRYGLDGDISGVDGAGGAGARFSLWSSSDEDASVTEVFGGDEHAEKHGDDGQGGRSGNDLHAGQPSRLASRSAAAAASGYDVSGGAFSSSVMACAGTFFDPATSSADKGRYKVRDPRLFDPGSMRRRPDTAFVMPALVPSTDSDAGSRGDGSGRGSTHSSDKSASSSTGVTLLLGCRVEDSGRGDRTAEQLAGRAEQVITVMFDRSKFNEQEARIWWTANQARIESIGQLRF